MRFSTFFRVSSYAMVGSGALALAVSDGLSAALAALFAVVLVVAWKLEGTRWQLPERVGLVIVLLSLPLFYLDWQFLSGGTASEKVGVSALGHLILFLSAVKLLQVKADRDWVFLYLISFFEVLLAAGLSVSPLFLLSLVLYGLFALSTVLAFEIRKARRGVKITETRLLVAPDSTLFRRLTRRKAEAARHNGEARRLPLVSLLLMLLIFGLAFPLFLVVPRTGANALSRTGDGARGFVGFSENVTLGDVGRLQESDQLVMRVRVEDAPEAAAAVGRLRWRGVALDFYNGRGWERTGERNTFEKANNERGFFQLGTTESLEHLTTQTFYVEALDTPVLFAAPRVVAVQGALPYLRSDAEGALSTRPHYQERISYKVYSDTTEPDEETLRKTVVGDVQFYPAWVARYLQLPEKIDPRIPRLAREWVVGAANQYDAARAIESRLQHDFGYTLDMKAGGPDPLADFLFNVRAGHCEYFSTAMAVMLRTQGIPARVVNGFQRGEYNDAAGVYTVTQREAHSWVEVYFPGTSAWVTFDPTPQAGRPAFQRTGIQGWFGKYAEALEMLWIQYVVGYDSQEQRSLANTVGNRFYDFRNWSGDRLNSMKETLAGWFSWLKIENEDGSVSYTRLALAILISVLTVVGLVLLVRRIKRLGFWRFFSHTREEDARGSVVEFYERMTEALNARGLKRAPGETPLEFASATGLPEAMQITRAYNRVRFGDAELSAAERAQIEDWLRRMEEKQG